MRKQLVILFLLPGLCFAAIGPKTVWEVQTTGSDSNGGGFDSGVGSPGTDQSVSGGQGYTDIVIGSTTTQATSTAHPFSATTNGPGNIVNIASGAGCTVQHAEIISVSGSTATFDKSLGTAASTCTGHLGDPKATLGAVEAVNVAGNTVYVKATANYSITGYVTFATSGTTANPITYTGYTSSRTDNGYATVIVSGAGNGYLFNVTGDHRKFVNFILNGNSQAGTSDWLVQGNVNFTCLNCEALNFTGFGFYSFSAVNTFTCINCYASGGTSCTAGYQITLNSLILNSSAVGNACSGLIDIGAGGNIGVVENFVSESNAGASSDGFRFSEWSGPNI